MDHALAGAVGLCLAGAITPGPNNLVVMREAARGGWRDVVPAIAGIVGGGLALLLLLSLGIGAVVTADPWALRAVAGAGGIYLIIIGLRMVMSRTRRQEPPDAALLPVGARALFVFQFLNPKAWVLVSTVSAVVQAKLGAEVALPYLIGLFVIVPVPCLILWSWAGAGIHRMARSGRAQVWIDRAMGLLLIACAMMLFVPLGL